jgi:hypothetical protein
VEPVTGPARRTGSTTHRHNAGARDHPADRRTPTFRAHLTPSRPINWVVVSCPWPRTAWTSVSASRVHRSHRDRFGVEPACAVLEMPVSTYYAAKKRGRHPSRRGQRDAWLKKEIMRVSEDRHKGRRMYGARKVWRQLRREGIEVARCCRTMPCFGRLRSAALAP